jgi:ketosteroid isomerase-like protein
MLMKQWLMVVGMSTFSLFISAQEREIKKVEAAAAFLINALESGDRKALEKISSVNLNYGHSNGRVEDRNQFIEALVSKTSDFISISVSEQRIQVTGKNAIVRQRLDATIMDSGKPGEVRLNVLLVFKKETGEWKLLARHASRVI